MVGLQSSALPPVLLCVTLSFRERGRTYARNQGHGAPATWWVSSFPFIDSKGSWGPSVLHQGLWSDGKIEISDPFSTNLKILISVIFFLARVYQKVPKESVVPSLNTI